MTLYGSKNKKNGAASITFGAYRTTVPAPKGKDVKNYQGTRHHFSGLMATFRNVFRGIVVGLAVLFLLSGCLKRGQDVEVKHTPETLSSPREIGISYITQDNTFFSIVANRAKEILEDNGFVVTMISAENDPEKQENHIHEYIEKKAAAILLIPCNSTSIGQSVRAANQAEIPVFTADVAVLDPGADVVCHVATDNYGGGKIAGHQILEAVARKGKIAVIDYPGIESVQMRLKGFREVIDYANNEGAEVQIVSIVSAFGDRAVAQEATKSLLRNDPDIKAVFAANDPMAFGVFDALTELDKVKQVRLIGFDGTPEAMKMINEGTIYADIIQFPEEIASHVAHAMILYLDGKSVPSRILIPTSAYTRKHAVSGVK